MKKVLLTGSGGQLGRSLRQLMALQPELECVATDVAFSAEEKIEPLDLTDPDAVEEMMGRGFDFVVNCAAYTAVDKAEDCEELCREVNSRAVRNIGDSAARHGVKVVHVSTDYVFDGEGFKPYEPSDPVNPRSVYGKTKLEGEWQLIDAMGGVGYVIVRTAWLYSPYGSNFVKTMLRLGMERSELKVVADQVGSPTYALDLAAAIIDVMLAPEFKEGIYHYTDEGVASWYDFTKAIHEIAGISGCEVSPCTSDEYPAKAPRPHYSVLSKKKIRDVYGVRTPYWRDSLKDCIQILIK